jgi:hypothetical protein
MATTIITGRDLSLTIDGDVYDAQASSVTLTRTADRQEYEVLDGTVYKTLKYTAEMVVEMFQDWNAVGSLCEALWNAADTAPDTALAFTFVANTGATFTGSVFPSFPDAGGTAPDALTVSVTMTVEEGAVTLA